MPVTGMGGHGADLGDTRAGADARRPWPRAGPGAGCPRSRRTRRYGGETVPGRASATRASMSGTSAARGDAGHFWVARCPPPPRVRADLVAQHLDPGQPKEHRPLPRAPADLTGERHGSAGSDQFGQGPSNGRGSAYRRTRRTARPRGGIGPPAGSRCRGPAGLRRGPTTRDCRVRTPAAAPSLVLRMPARSSHGGALRLADADPTTGSFPSSGADAASSDRPWRHSGDHSRDPGGRADTLLGGPLAHRVEQGTFNPKVARSRLARPTSSEGISGPRWHPPNCPS